MISAQVSFKVESPSLEQAVIDITEKATESFGDTDFAILSIVGDSEDNQWTGLVLRMLESEHSRERLKQKKRTEGLPSHIAEAMNALSRGFPNG